MNTFHKIANGESVESRVVESAPSADWLPEKPATPPSFDFETEELVEVAPLVEPDGVTRRWQVLTLAERRPAGDVVFSAPVPNDGSYVPPEAPLWALREICILRRHTAAIEAALSALPEPQQTIARNRWEKKDTLSRGSSLIMAMQSILGWPDSYVDDLFRSANAL